MKNYILVHVNFEYGISKNVVSRTSINREGKSYMVEWLLATEASRGLLDYTLKAYKNCWGHFFTLGGIFYTLESIAMLLISLVC